MKKFLLIIPLLLIIAAFVFSFYVFSSKPSTPEEQTEVLKNLESSIGISSPIQDYEYSDWLRDTGEQLPLKGKIFWAGSTNIIDEVESKKVYDDLMIINKGFLNNYADLTINFFLENGFTQSSKNTYDYTAGVFHQERLGFEKGSLKCLVTFYQTTDPFGSFSCGNINSEELAKQQQFIPPFKGKYDPKNPLSFRVDEVKGEFARGTASEPILGYVWIAQKVNSGQAQRNETNYGWKVIWKGEEIPLCSQMEKLKIPKSIYKDCYQDQ